MFSILFLGLAAAASTDPILVVDDRPAISINLGRYDLGRRGDLRRVEASIHYAARQVCARDYGVAIYEERVACVKGAIADGDRQLSEIATRNRSAAALSAASISISTK